jgi:hypothetical protein
VTGTAGLCAELGERLRVTLILRKKKLSTSGTPSPPEANGLRVPLLLSMFVLLCAGLNFCALYKAHFLNEFCTSIKSK